MYLAGWSPATTIVGLTVMLGYSSWKSEIILLNSASRVVSHGCQISTVAGAAFCDAPDCPGAHAASTAAAPPAARVSTDRRTRPCFVVVATRSMSVSFSGNTTAFYFRRTVVYRVTQPPSLAPRWPP